ncbi:MAG: sigma-70 family RNA polymerase sigma factor [bacterium]
MGEVTDEQLIGQYLKGDEGSLEVLIKRYLKPIYSFVYKNIGNPVAAEDVTQEVFVKVWKNLKKPVLSLSKGFDPKQGKFKSWIFTIAKNSSIDFLRKKKIATIALTENSAIEKSDFIKNIESKNYMAKIHNALKELSPSYQAVILLKNESNLTFREIAVSLGEPLNTIKSRYRRALITLKQML